MKISYKIFKEINPKPMASGYRYVIYSGKRPTFDSNLFSKRKKALWEAKGEVIFRKALK